MSVTTRVPPLDRVSVIYLAIIKVNDTIGVDGVYLGTVRDAIKGVHNMLDEISRKVSRVESITADVRNNTGN
jgi:hypothetical protein